MLLEAIDRVCAGEVWIDRALLASVFAESVPQKNTDLNAQNIATFTKREREITCLIGEGLRNKEIASRLFLSERTVHNHRASVFRKLGVGDRLELAVFAQKNNLIAPDK